MKILQSILSLICLVAIVLAGAENPDGSCCLPWTISWLAVMFLSGLGLNLTFKMEKTPKSK